MHKQRVSTDLSRHGLAILVDGHHLYLHALTDIVHCNDIVARGYLPAIELIKHENTVLERIPINAHSLSNYSLLLLKEIEKRIEQMLVKTLELQRQRDAVGWNSLNRRSRAEVIDLVEKKTLLVKVNASIKLFDALLPDEDAAIRALSTHFKQQVRSHYLHKKIDEFIDLAKWGHYDQQLPNGSNLIVPWRLKNDYVALLQKNGAHVVPGEKRLRINNNGPFFQEKGVDVNLTIHALEASQQAEIGNFCLVTNDADYAPLVKTLRAKQKNVFVTLMDEDYSSDSLKAAAGESMVLTKSRMIQDMGADTHRFKELDAMQMAILLRSNAERLQLRTHPDNPA